MKMKKFLAGAFLGMFALAGVAVLPNYASATGDNWTAQFGGNGAVSTKDSVWGRKTTNDSLLTTAKRTINWILGILASVALVICLYAGFLMVTSAGDQKKYEKGLSVLKYAAIGLAIIGLSWMIVSVIFWFINQASNSNANITEIKN